MTKHITWISLIVLSVIGGAFVGFVTWQIRDDVVITIMSIVAFALIAGGVVGVISVLTEPTPKPEPTPERVLIEHKPWTITAIVDTAKTDYVDAKYRIIDNGD
jgi:hypothetical protein